ncbi:MAG: hypothetical protein KDC38_04005 [Planctomycetes bacterium]|nr:hypothetical protein [Planctomycetota bacterium]
MSLRREVLLTLGGLVFLNLALAFSAMGLFARMGPAIAHIMEDNVDSIVSCEQVLSELAKADGAASAQSRSVVRDSLVRLRENITEREERPIVDSIETIVDSALDGEQEARTDLVGRLQSLIAINRNAMRAVDEEARRLGSAGAWAAVVVGFLSFVASLLIGAGLRRRLLDPLEDLHAVLEDVRKGQQLRRCRARSAPYEVLKVAESVNQLLDERLSEREANRIERTEIHRLALSTLLERQTGPVAVVRRDGTLVRANTAMLEWLSGGDGRRRELSDPEAASTGGSERVTLEEAGWVVFRHGDAPSRTSDDGAGAARSQAD